MSALLFRDDETLKLAQNALEREMMIIQASIKITQSQLHKFEREFALSSDDFYEKYQHGKLGDRPEIMRWAMEVQALRKLTSDYQKLEEVECVPG
jgi:hypothetical protein